MDTASTPYSVRQCSKCPRDTGYYCESCQCDLCPQCKENHGKDLETIYHNVATHRDKSNNIPAQEFCVEHPNNVYIKYCEPCHVPVCDYLLGHKIHRFLVKHRMQNIQEAYKTERLKHRGTIHNISKALFLRPDLLPEIKAEMKTCRAEFSLCQSEMLSKAKKLNNLIDRVQNDFMSNVFCKFDFKHRCLKQKLEMIKQNVSIQRYVSVYERSSIRPLQFLSSIKTTRLPQIHNLLHTSQFSVSESLRKEDVINTLSIMHFKERKKRRLENKCLLKQFPGPEFLHSFSVTSVNCCVHISCRTSDQVWVSDDECNLILTNATGDSLYFVNDICHGLYGKHTVNSDIELIYIDVNYNINKMSKDMTTTTTFIERADFIWIPHCIYWSPSTGDLLVGMYNNKRWRGKVFRYNQTGRLTQTIQYNQKGMTLYREPINLTDNKNGDIIVCDFRRAIVVTEYGGKHRFSYTGHTPGSLLEPFGICTDALSHILFCDCASDSVQMLDQDGELLSYLLVRPSGVISPYCLSYNVRTHYFWVGSANNNNVCVFRTIFKEDEDLLASKF